MVFVELIDFVLHIDRYIEVIIQNYGTAAYFILFLIIFCETGLVITPFLPGDSLLFVTGAFAAKGALNVGLLFFILVFAAVLGDTLNYSIGNYFGEKIFANSRFFRREYLEKTKEFYRKYGGKTIIVARFLPIIRTFAPFVAGIGKMNYVRFLSFNVIGGILWVGLFLFSGYYFGRIPFVERNLTLFILIIILTSLIPPFVEYIKKRTKRSDRIASA